MLRTLAQAQSNSETYELLSSTPPLFSQNLQGENSIDPKDIQQCKDLLEKITNNQQTLQDKSQKILEKIKERVFNKGIGFYNAKNIIFMQYLINLQFYELFRLNAVDLTQGHGLQLYKRLVYLKTLLLKLEPVEKKLDYQKNKMLRVSDLVAVKKDAVAEEQSAQEEDEDQQLGKEEKEANDEAEQNDESQEEDALAYQPRPQSLLLAKQKKDQKIQKEGKYVAPKISATLSGYDKKKRKQQLQEQRKKAFLIRKYRDDIIEDDEARQTGVQNQVAEKIKRKFKQKTSLQEENFMRLPESKKQKFWKKQLIQKHSRSDPLKQTLKEVQTIGQIYQTQARQAEQQRPQKPQRSQSFKNKQGKSHKTGFKKQKRQ